MNYTSGKLGTGVDAPKKASGGTSLGAKVKARKATADGRGKALREVLSAKPNPKSKVGNRKPATPAPKLGGGGAMSGGGKL